MEKGMIERVAKALWDAAEAEEYDAQDDLTKSMYRRGARAAIEAMRIPTKVMMDAGWETTSTHVVDGRPDEIWPAMIDAALKEQEKVG